MFKSNLSEISKQRYRSQEEKGTLENTKLLNKSRLAVIKLFNDYSWIVSAAKQFMKKVFEVRQHVYFARRSLTIQIWKQ